jgi:hypothetical protein
MGFDEFLQALLTAAGAVGAAAGCVLLARARAPVLRWAIGVALTITIALCTIAVVRSAPLLSAEWVAAFAVVATIGGLACAGLIHIVHRALDVGVRRWGPALLGALLSCILAAVILGTLWWNAELSNGLLVRRQSGVCVAEFVGGVWRSFMTLSLLGVLCMAVWWSCTRLTAPERSCLRVGLGCLGWVAAFFATLTFVCLVSSVEGHDWTMRDRRERLRQLGMAVLEYQSQCNGEYPPSLITLYTARYVSDPRLVNWPEQNLIYTRRDRMAHTNDVVVFSWPPYPYAPFKGTVLLFYVDGATEEVTVKEGEPLTNPRTGQVIRAAQERGGGARWEPTGGRGP